MSENIPRRWLMELGSPERSVVLAGMVRPLTKSGVAMAGMPEVRARATAAARDRDFTRILLKGTRDQKRAYGRALFYQPHIAPS
jgi:hypothetical protein